MKIAAFLTFFSTFVFVVFANGTRADAIEAAGTTQTVPDNGLLLVSTIDGFLSAVDAQTGSMKWRFKEEPVLHCSRDVQTGFVFLPSPKDGQLYVLEDGDLNKLPFTIPQLVKASPSKTSDGILYAGSKKDVWISINPETGSRMETLPPPSPNSFCPVSHPETVFIGRTEYQLSMLDTKNKAKKWNATFTDYSSHLLPPESSYPFQHFTNDGKIATFDKETGKLLWTMNYQGVIVNLYLMKSDGLHLLPSQAVGKDLFEEITEDDVAPDLSWFDSIKATTKSPLFAPEIEIEVISNGKLRSALYLDETANGLFAIPMIVDNMSSTLPKSLGPRLIDGPLPDAVDVNADANLIVTRPQLPKNIPLTMTTYKTVDGEYLLLGFHKYPKISMKSTLQVSDPSSIPYLMPYHYLEYQTVDGNQVTQRCVGSDCGKRPSRRGQKMLPGRTKQLQIGQEPSDDLTFSELITELWFGYPLAVLSLVSAFAITVCTTIFMCGRASGSSFPHPVSRETSHASQRSRAHSSDQSKKTWSQLLFRSGSKSSSGPPVFEEDEDTSLEPGWRKIGKIQYDTKSVLGQGCEGTIVYKGIFDGREAAVKRVITEIVSFVDREIELLRQSDRHPNVIRYFCSEADHTFRFIALELCDCSLKDYVLKPDIQRGYADFSKADLLKQATEGLAYLHQNNIVHRDIKPQNILLTRDLQNRVRVLISDFGLCKKIRQGHASISRMSGLAGTEGWIAPEAYTDDASITCLVDVFSLGCLYFYVLTNGKHPFGDSIKRQNNILRGEYDLVPLTRPDTSFNIAALNLIENMVQLTPNSRPRLHVVLSHPMFWSNERTLQFFMDVSDRIEKEDENNDVVRRLEAFSTRVTRNWHNEICEPLKQDLRKFRSYRTNSIRDLLRALRNKKHHYRELPIDVKESLGEIPNGYVFYWTSRFPRLLMHIYNAMICCAEEAAFTTYYPIEAHSFCNRRLQEELNTDFIVAGPTIPLTHTTSMPSIMSSPGKTPRKDSSTDGNWRSEQHGPMSANAAKKLKKKKNKSRYSALAEVEENGPDGDARESSPS